MDDVLIKTFVGNLLTVLGRVVSENIKLIIGNKNYSSWPLRPGSF